MTTQEAKNKMKKVQNLGDFQDLFFSDNGDGEMTADFEVVFKISENNYTTNKAARVFDSNGSCTNSYMKLEDGYIPYPF